MCVTGLHEDQKAQIKVTISLTAAMKLKITDGTWLGITKEPRAAPV